MSLEGDINQVLNERVSESRLREMMDQPDPTYLFKEMTREGETIRTQASRLEAPTFNPNQPNLGYIHTVYASSPLRAESSNGTLTLSFDSGVGGVTEGGGAASNTPVAKVPFLVFTNGVVVTRNFHVDP